jgi:hypothetical protein
MRLKIAGILVLGTIMPVLASQTFAINGMELSDQQEVRRWLDEHPEQRLANSSDCDCQEEISELRRGVGKAWPAQPSYQPYYTRGDFDGNGQQDFAVLVRTSSGERKAQILIFLRQPASQASRIVARPLDRRNLKGFGLFVGKADGARARLLAGAFGSEGYEIEVK